MSLIRAEILKYKHTMLNKLLFIAPLFTVIFSFLMGGVINFQSIASYWWYAFILQGMIAVLCFLSNRAEQVSGNNLIIYSMPLDFQKVKIAGHLVLAGKILVAQMICVLLIQSFPHLLFPDYVIYDFVQLLLANVVLVITTMWQIPFCFIIMRFFGKFTAVFANVILGIVMMTVMGNGPYWMICPYCWSGKQMEGILGIGMNGVFAGTPLSYSLLNLITLLFSIALFVGLSKLDAYLYEKERDK